MVVLISRSAAIRTIAKMLIRVGVISGNEMRQKVVKRPFSSYECRSASL
jgi:hypothetical protein